MLYLLMNKIIEKANKQTNKKLWSKWIAWCSSSLKPKTNFATDRDNYHLLSREQLVMLMRLSNWPQSLQHPWTTSSRWCLKKPASGVNKTKQQITYYGDAPFCKRSVRGCDYPMLSWGPGSMAAGRRWRKQQHSSSDVDCLHVQANAKNKEKQS